MGVPLERTNPLLPVFSSRYLLFIRRLKDLAEPVVPIPATFDIFVAVVRFLYM